MKYINSLFLFFFLTASVFAKPIINIADTTIPRGDIYSIPISVDLSDTDEINSAGTIEFVFEYDQFVLDIKSVSFANSELFPDAESEIKLNLSNKPAQYRVLVTNPDINVRTGCLFDLMIEGLVAPCDSSYFRCSEVLIDGKNIALESDNAVFHVSGENIIQKFPTNLFINYPNPFRGSTTFTFNLQTGGETEFEIYNYSGTRVYSYQELSKYIHIHHISGENGQTEFSNLNGEFPSGKYTLQFVPSEDWFSSGLYILTMKNNGKFYSKFFVYSK